MRYDMLALDIDGTLTNSDKKITPATEYALREVLESGVTVVLASGRPTPGLEAFAEQLELAKYGGYILSYNGARITDCRTGEIIFQQTLPVGMVSRFHDYANEHGLGMMTYENRSILTGSPIDSYMEIESRINGMPILTQQDFPQSVPELVNKCLLTGDPDVLAVHEKKLAEEYAGVLSIYRSEPFFLEIMPKGVDKAYSLSVLLEKTGLSKEALVCCGDGYNDISMLRYAGLGVAMHNAQPAVKAVADYITESNNADGIVRVITSFLLRPTKKSRVA